MEHDTKPTKYFASFIIFSFMCLEIHILFSLEKNNREYQMKLDLQSIRTSITIDMEPKNLYDY